MCKSVSVYKAEQKRWWAVQKKSGSGLEKKSYPNKKCADCLNFVKVKNLINSLDVDLLRKYNESLLACLFIYLSVRMFACLLSISVNENICCLSNRKGTCLCVHLSVSKHVC